MCVSHTFYQVWKIDDLRLSVCLSVYLSVCLLVVINLVGVTFIIQLTRVDKRTCKLQIVPVLMIIVR